MNSKTVFKFVLLAFYIHTNKAANVIFDGGSSRLELTGNLNMTFSLSGVDPSTNKTSILATIDLDATPTGVYGSVANTSVPNEIMHSLMINFGSLENDNLTLDRLDLTFEMVTNLNTSWWTLDLIHAEFDGQLLTHCQGENCTVSGKEDIVVNPRRGYTSNPADRVCTKGYTTCAPINICWACKEQNYSAVASDHMKGTVLPGIFIPGMKLQPFYGAQKNLTSFGSEWNCDPLISIGLWQGLLLTFFFAWILAWAISYLATTAPITKFDDPNGNPISVPMTDM